MKSLPQQIIDLMREHGMERIAFRLDNREICLAIDCFFPHGEDTIHQPIAISRREIEYRKPGAVDCLLKEHLIGAERSAKALKTSGRKPERGSEVQKCG